MNLMTPLMHGATRLWSNRYRTQFEANSRNVEATQSKILAGILRLTHTSPGHRQYKLKETESWESFANKVPITDYSYWQPLINKDLKNQPGNLSQSPIRRHQPTSGSTSAIKWIPYTAQFLTEINNALMPWISDMYEHHKGIRHGYHYWSVSWVPSSLRTEVDENVNDDLKVLPWWERFIAAQYMAVPDTVAQAASSDDTLFASLAWLVARHDLSFLSVWSPTFALTLISALQDNKDELVAVLKQGDWLNRRNSLRHISCPKAPERSAILASCSNTADPEFLAKLWPHLSLISCWDTSSSKVWADKLHSKFPQAKIEGKGLWATEGAVTIPLSGKYPLAINSHYYEFLDLDSNEVVPSWKLEIGMQVSPLLTNGSGFLRYKLNDKLLVNDFLNATPCFEFQGRIDGTDLAGEKLSTDTAQQVIDYFHKKMGVKPITLLAISGDIQHSISAPASGRYVLICEPGEKFAAAPSDHIALENILLEHFHYQLARDLNQLSAASVLITDQATEIYNYRCTQRGMAQGNIKIEPLVLWNTDLHPALEALLREASSNPTYPKQKSVTEQKR